MPPVSAPRPAAAAPETVTVDQPVAACDGAVDLGLGHPRVFLDLSASGRAVCPYCSRTFLLAPGARPAAGH
jgi:uncharacterized Zn-finger protein